MSGGSSSSGNRGKFDAPPVSSDAFENHLHFAMRGQASLLKPTWELTGPTVPALHMHSVARGSGPLPLLPQAPAGPGKRSAQDPLADASIKMMRKGPKQCVSWEDVLDRKQNAALLKWFTLVQLDLPSFDVGRRCDVSAPLGGGDLQASLSHALAGKAPGTLDSRAGPLLRFVAWCRHHQVVPLPLEEATLYRFACAMEQGSAPTFLRSLMVSVSFAHHVLGLQGASDCLASGRLVGIARQAYLRKRKKKQRPPLTTDMVARMEVFICKGVVTSASGSSNLHDVLWAGFFLLVLFARGRCSDGQAVEQLSLDEPDGATTPSGYIEGVVTRTKTSFSVERKTRHLPVVLPRLGITGQDWAGTWLNARSAAGVPSGPGKPLMPARGGHGSWGPVPPSASVAGGWLRAILSRLGCPANQVSEIGTHSLKATPLSWCAKYGIESHHRRILGYHTCPRDRTMVLYSRDAVAASIRKLEAVLRAVRVGEFSPDSTRSGHFTQVVPAKADEPAAVSDASTESSSEDSQDASEVGDDLDASEAAIESLAVLAPPGGEGTWGRRRLSRILHVTRDESDTTFRCGRTVGRNYMMLDRPPTFADPLCQRCFPE